MAFGMMVCRRLGKIETTEAPTALRHSSFYHLPPAQEKVDGVPVGGKQLKCSMISMVMRGI